MKHITPKNKKTVKKLKKLFKTPGAFFTVAQKLDVDNGCFILRDNKSPDQLFLWGPANEFVTTAKIHRFPTIFTPGTYGAGTYGEEDQYVELVETTLDEKPVLITFTGLFAHEIDVERLCFGRIQPAQIAVSIVVFDSVDEARRGIAAARHTAYFNKFDYLLPHFAEYVPSDRIALDALQKVVGDRQVEFNQT